MKLLYYLLPVIFIVTACGESSSESPKETIRSSAPATNVSTDKSDYPVFPNADEGAAPNVSAEEGGRGFTGDGWQTNEDYDFVGDPRAIRGGRLREYVRDFPGTLRMEGPESNTYLNVMIQGLVYETLLTMHPTTLEYMPALATHWQISEDKLTYRFRINPNARWPDGNPVVSADVIATWKLMLDKGLQAPMSALVWSKFKEPVPESKYIVSVTSTRQNWRNFLYFSQSLPVFPAHVLENVDGATYLKDYNFKLLPGSGPYTIEEPDIDKGRSLTIRRRTNYWADSHRRNVGVNNFDEIRETVVRDENIAFEMFKRGDLDYYSVARARIWVEELDFDNVKRGLVQKRKIFTQDPSGIAGLAFNTRKPPFNDLRVRKALALALNRKLLLEKLFYDEYLPQNSYYAGTIYENPNNPKNLYDPRKALELLNEAGWQERNTRGQLMKDGTPLSIELLYHNKSSEPYLTIFQEDLRKLGVGLNLRLVTPETLFQLLMERKFDLTSIAWGGLLFPNPETSFHSTLADVDNTNNITGVKSARIDEICDAYDEMFDVDERTNAIREIDGILASEYHYILQWYAPNQRLAYWNRFGQPEAALSRFGDYKDLVNLWWFDPERSSAVDQALGDSSQQLKVGPIEDRHWLEYAEHEADSPTTSN